MLYDLGKEICFVHIPRTGGLSITSAFAETVPGRITSVVVDACTGRHLTAWQLKSILGPCWDRIYRFAVMRSPWEIVTSNWRLMQKALPGFRDYLLAGPWRDSLERMEADPSFERFVRDEYLGPYSGVAKGGFMRTWCLGPDLEDLGVDVWRFEKLGDRWRDFAMRFSLPAANLSIINSTAHCPTPWTRPLIDAIGELCCGDIAWGGYQPPEVAA